MVDSAVVYPGSRCPLCVRMEILLDLYGEAYAPKRPVICVDEWSCPLIGEARIPIPAQAGQPERYDDESERHGVVNLFAFFEPLTGERWMAVTQQRTQVDFAHQMQRLQITSNTTPIALDNPLP